MEDSWINVHGEKLGMILEEFGVYWSLEDELCELFLCRKEVHVRRRERFWWRRIILMIVIVLIFLFNYILF
jgi:hypothetical protein